MTTISRRQLMQALSTIGLLSSVNVRATSKAFFALSDNPAKPAPGEPSQLGAPMMRDPVWVYDIWSAYTDGVTVPDDTRLNEELAMKELHELVRLKRLGVHFDYYMMNAFWFAPDGAYREWRKPDWPNGPDRWIAACQENDLKPGLWFATNVLWKMNLAPQWQDSLELKQEHTEKFHLDSMSLYEGGFLLDFMQTLQYWYERGIRLFEFDMADFDAATPAARKTQSEQEIRQRNQVAFRDALRSFRRKNPDAMLVAFNGFRENMNSTPNASAPKNPVDLRWLEVFDTLYCGDIRVSDVPEVNFWRSVDLYGDDMVRRYEQSFVPLERIDPVGFVMGTTWFGYYRKASAWKGMLLLTAARGGWKKTIYGNLELLSDDDARWFAKVQKMYAPLLAMGRTKTFGGVPSEVEPYGFGSLDRTGAIYTVVNPTQEVRTIDFPLLSRVQGPLSGGRVIFRDAGFVPLLHHTQIVLGPGQMAVAGFGSYAEQEYDLGIQHDVIIPRKIELIDASFHSTAKNVIETTLSAPSRADLRIIFRQYAQDGSVRATSPGWAANGNELDPRRLRTNQVMKIEAQQNGKNVEVKSDQEDKLNYGGTSWGSGEIRNRSLVGGQPITIRCSSAEKEPAVLKGRIYAVEY